MKASTYLTAFYLTHGLRSSILFLSCLVIAFAYKFLSSAIKRRQLLLTVSQTVALFMDNAASDQYRLEKMSNVATRLRHCVNIVLLCAAVTRIQRIPSMEARSSIARTVAAVAAKPWRAPTKLMRDLAVDRYKALRDHVVVGLRTPVYGVHCLQSRKTFRFVNDLNLCFLPAVTFTSPLQLHIV
jgi:hypothetical protein